VSDALLLVAARIDDAAAELRARAARIDQRCATTNWTSPGARRYYARLGGLNADLAACATDLDALADQFRRAAVRHAARQHGTR
jgi:hypothetical protein